LNNTEHLLKYDKEVQTSNSYTNELALRKKIKLLQQKLRRKQKKINNLNDLIMSLNSRGHIDLEQQNLILNNFNGKFFLNFTRYLVSFLFA
jgi:uncharacterized protein YlxW (UPF0749 family)